MLVDVDMNHFLRLEEEVRYFRVDFGVNGEIIGAVNSIKSHAITVSMRFKVHEDMQKLNQMSGRVISTVIHDTKT